MDWSKITNKMAEVANHLDLTSITVGHGLSQPLFLVNNFHFKVLYLTGVGTNYLCNPSGENWNFYIRLTKQQYNSICKMRMLQPKMQEMRERFGDDHNV